MNPYIYTYKEHSGNGIVREITDLVVSTSKRKARKMVLTYLKNTLPSWKTYSTIKINLGK
jgi:hypothetical protein